MKWECRQYDNVYPCKVEFQGQSSREPRPVLCPFGVTVHETYWKNVHVWRRKIWTLLSLGRLK